MTPHDPDCLLIDNDHLGPHMVRPGHPKAEVQHALDALNAAMDKLSYGDSAEMDLLEAHHALESILAEARP